MDTVISMIFLYMDTVMPMFLTTMYSHFGDHLVTVIYTTIQLNAWQHIE